MHQAHTKAKLLKSFGAPGRIAPPTKVATWPLHRMLAKAMSGKGQFWRYSIKVGEGIWIKCSKIRKLNERWITSEGASRPDDD